MKKKKNSYVVPISIAILIVLVIFFNDIVSLFQSDFKKNLNDLNKINEKFDSSLYRFPSTVEQNELLLAELNEFEYIENEAFSLLVDIRLKLVESDIFFKEGWKYGRGSTTIYGFGCRKGLARITEATGNRNMSSLVGYKAVDLMRELIEDYPREAELANVTVKTALFLNASFYAEIIDASKDRKFIERLCIKKNESEV